MTTATISFDHYLTLLEMSAESAGNTSAQQVLRTGRFIHPGDPMGSLLAHAWEVDHNLPKFCLKSYFRTLWAVLQGSKTTPPSAEEALSSLPQAINKARFPKVKVEGLIGDLRRDSQFWFETGE